MTTKNNGTLKYRVGQLEKEVGKLDNKMDLLMENHLPHIERELVVIKTMVNQRTLLNVGAIIVGILIMKFFV